MKLCPGRRSTRKQPPLFSIAVPLTPKPFVAVLYTLPAPSAAPTAAYALVMGLGVGVGDAK